MEDYRLSHQKRGKGTAYETRFHANPHRAMVWRLEQRVLDQVVRRAGWQPPAHYLDFACGTGRVLAYLEERFDRSVGVDVSEEMISVARSRTRRSELLLADLTQEDPLSGLEFDLITAFRFFPNAQPDLRRAAMRSLAAHLSNRGMLVFNNHLNAASLLRRMLRAIRRDDPDKGMLHEEALELITEYGLALERVYAIAFLPVSERRLQWLVPVIRPCESLLAWMNVPAWRAAAQNLIYVCRRAG